MHQPIGADLVGHGGSWSDSRRKEWSLLGLLDFLECSGRAWLRTLMKANGAVGVEGGVP